MIYSSKLPCASINTVSGVVLYGNLDKEYNNFEIVSWKYFYQINLKEFFHPTVLWYIIT